MTRDQRISPADVQHIASLARLSVSAERADALGGDLNAILAHMDVLSRVDTRGVSESVGVGVPAMPLRVDAGPPIPLIHPLESFAPSVRDGLLIVPRLSSHETTE